jgi:DNA-binding NarL/FixJ family response regulator
VLSVQFIMATSNQLRILLIDDHALVREGLRRLIDDQPDMEVIADAGDGQLGVQLAQDLTPDIALVDVSMPGLDGAQITQMITKTCPRVRVIALSRHDEDGFVRRLLEAGASGYALKQSASTELARGIRAVAAGERYLDPCIGRARAAVTAIPRSASGVPAALSVDEERVLGMIALGHSHHEIADLLSLDMDHVLAIRETAVLKAGLTTRSAIARYAQERGWLGRGSGGSSR